MLKSRDVSIKEEREEVKRAKLSAEELSHDELSHLVDFPSGRLRYDITMHAPCCCFDKGD